MNGEKRLYGSYDGASWPYIESPYFKDECNRLGIDVFEKSELMDDVRDRRKQGKKYGKYGIRKIRVVYGGKGKSGGARVVYYYTEHFDPPIADTEDRYIYFLIIFAKSDKEELTKKEIQILESLVEAEIKRRTKCVAQEKKKTSSRKSKKTLKPRRK